MDTRSLKVGIIGTGRVGPSLGRVLQDSGFKVVGIWGRNSEKALYASKFIGSCKAFDSLLSLVGASDVIFIAVSDGAIGEVSSRVASLDIDIKGKVFSHTSGSLPSTVMEPIRGSGGFISSFHPLQSISSMERGVEVLRGSFVAIEGDDEAKYVLFELARGMGCIPFSIDGSSKTLYHASAVMACNLFYALYWLATQLLSACGVENALKDKVLIPLVKGSVSNVEKVGCLSAITGPVVRGDISTVMSHLKAMEEEGFSVHMKVYKDLSLVLLDMVKERNLLPDDRLEELRRLLGS